MTEYTHPDVLTIGVQQGWADPITDPTLIDWAPRQAAAAIPFEVVNGRPVNPIEPGLPGGRNAFGHWGEQLAADALVTLEDQHGARWVLMVERGDGHGWAVPGGYIEPGEAPAKAASRELAEETGFEVAEHLWTVSEPVYVPDPRGSREAWIVTVISSLTLPTMGPLPTVTGMDDAVRADWITADSYDALLADLDARGGTVFPAHRRMLRDSH